MKTIDDSDEGPSSFWGKMEYARVKPFAAQFYSPDYIEKYPFDSLDPSYANKLDLSFAALSPAEPFLRLPKGIVENTDGYLSEGNLEKMLTWLGDHAIAQDQEYLGKVSDTRNRAWGIAKRFNRTLERRREKLIRELGEEEVERLRGVEKEERRQRVEARRKREEEANKWWREEVEKRKERKRKEREEKEEEEEQEREGKRRKLDKEQGEEDGEVEFGAVLRRVEAIPKVEVVPKVEASPSQVSYTEKYKEESLLMFIKRLAGYFEGVKTRIVEFESMREEGNQNKTYLDDFMKDVGERVDGSIRKAFGTLKSHMRWYKAVDGRLWKAAVTGVVDALEYVYLPVELKVVTEPGEEHLKIMEASDELKVYGAKKKLGDLLLKFFFETGVDKKELVRWVKSEKDLHRKLGMLLEKMTQAGMDRTRMQKVARPFGIKL